MGEIVIFQIPQWYLKQLQTSGNTRPSLHGFSHPLSISRYSAQPSPLNPARSWTASESETSRTSATPVPSCRTLDSIAQPTPHGSTHNSFVPQSPNGPATPQYSSAQPLILESSAQKEDSTFESHGNVPNPFRRYTCKDGSKRSRPRLIVLQVLKRLRSKLSARRLTCHYLLVGRPAISFT